MKYAINDNKLMFVIANKIKQINEKYSEKVKEANIEAFNDFKSKFTAEDEQAYINGTLEEEKKKLVAELINDTVSGNIDVFVLTLEDVRNMFTFTDKELKEMLDGKEQ